VVSLNLSDVVLSSKRDSLVWLKNILSVYDFLVLTRVLKHEIIRVLLGYSRLLLSHSLWFEVLPVALELEVSLTQELICFHCLGVQIVVLRALNFFKFRLRTLEIDPWRCCDIVSSMLLYRVRNVLIVVLGFEVDVAMLRDLLLHLLLLVRGWLGLPIRLLQVSSLAVVLKRLVCVL
jgi:hypothetical protein